MYGKMDNKSTSYCSVLWDGLSRGLSEKLQILPHCAARVQSALALVDTLGTSFRVRRSVSPHYIAGCEKIKTTNSLSTVVKLLSSCWERRMSV